MQSIELITARRAAFPSCCPPRIYGVFTKRDANMHLSAALLPKGATFVRCLQFTFHREDVDGDADDPTFADTTALSRT